MTRDMVKALNDSDLMEVLGWVQDEQKARAVKRKAEAIAKIKELAQTVGVSVHFEGRRGRPTSSNTPKTAKGC